MKEIIINLAHRLDDRTIALHNGPGFRWCIWTQGCSLRCCSICLNPEMLDPDGGYEYTIDDMIAALHEVSKHRVYYSKLRRMVPLEGITLLGGEPTDQAGALISICREAKELNMSVMLYSGMTLYQLENHNNKHIRELLAVTDLLVDGQFIEELYDDKLMWRGSSNQQIHILSDRYNQKDLEEAFVWQGKGVQFNFYNNGEFSISGIQSGAAAREFSRKLKWKN